MREGETRAKQKDRRIGEERRQHGLARQSEHAVHRTPAQALLASLPTPLLTPSACIIVFALTKWPVDTDYALTKLSASAYWTFEWAPLDQSSWPLLSRWYSPFSAFQSRRQSPTNVLDPSWAGDDSKLPDVVVLSLGYHLTELSVEAFASRAEAVFSLFADLPNPPKLIYTLNILPDPSKIPDKYSRDFKHRTKLKDYHKNLAILNLVNTTFPEVTVVDFMSMELPLGETSHKDAVHLASTAPGKYANDAFRDAVVQAVCEQFGDS